MWIRPGQLADPKDLPGVASFTAGMLREGTTKRSSSQIASEVDSLGASLDASSRFGASYTSITASGLINTAPQILDLMSDVVLNPAFADDELAKYKQTEGANLEQRLSNPDSSLRRRSRGRSMAIRRWPSPRRPRNPSTKSAAADLKKFHDAALRTGQHDSWHHRRFETAEMEELVAKSFGAWKGAADPR